MFFTLAPALLVATLSSAPPTWAPPVGWAKFARVVLNGDANVKVVLGKRCVEVEAYHPGDWALDATSRPALHAHVAPMFKGQLGKRAKHKTCASLKLYMEGQDTLVQLVYVFASRERRGHYTVGRRLRVVCGNVNCPPGKPDPLFEDD